MRVLVACEFSGTVRDSFIKRGHDAWSCDLDGVEPEGEFLDNHIKGDCLGVISDNWDLIIAHPPCTYLTNAGARWLYDERYPNRKQHREQAAEFFMKLYNAPSPRVAVENPVGYMSKAFRKPDQIVRPYEYGHNATKATCLWLRGLPKLSPTNVIEPIPHTSKSGRKWCKWFFDSSLISDLKERSKFRNRTFQGIADAMADQWGRVEEV